MLSKQLVEIQASMAIYVDKIFDFFKIFMSFLKFWLSRTLFMVGGRLSINKV